MTNNDRQTSQDAAGYRRYFMTLSYCGASFHGWQSQPNAVSVQSTIESAMSLVLRRSVGITGAGRTDTGVNARRMVAHFDLPLTYDTGIIDRLARALYSFAGAGIAT